MTPTQAVVEEHTARLALARKVIGRGLAYDGGVLVRLDWDGPGDLWARATCVVCGAISELRLFGAEENTIRAECSYLASTLTGRHDCHTAAVDD